MELQREDQLVLIEAPGASQQPAPPPWALDARTRKIGRTGVATAREVLRQARRVAA